MYEEKKYIIMSMIIEGPKQPGNDIDTYFHLLVEELLTVWIDAPAVKCYDAYKKEIFDLLRCCAHHSRYASIRQHIGVENKGRSRVCHMHG